MHFRAGVQDVGVLAIFKLTTAFCNVFRYLHWRITLRGKFCVDETVCCLRLVMAALDRDIPLSRVPFTKRWRDTASFWYTSSCMHMLDVL